MPRRSACPWPVGVLPAVGMCHLRPRAPRQRTPACWSRTLAHGGAHTRAQRCASPAWPEPEVLRIVRRPLARLSPAWCVAGHCLLHSEGPCARPPRHGQALVAVGVHRVTGMLRGPHDLAALLAGRVIALSTSYASLGAAPAARAGAGAGSARDTTHLHLKACKSLILLKVISGYKHCYSL